MHWSVGARHLKFKEFTYLTYKVLLRGWPWLFCFHARDGFQLAQGAFFFLPSSCPEITEKYSEECRKNQAVLSAVARTKSSKSKYISVFCQSALWKKTVRNLAAFRLCELPPGCEWPCDLLTWKVWGVSGDQRSTQRWKVILKIVKAFKAKVSSGLSRPLFITVSKCFKQPNLSDLSKPEIAPYIGLAE